MLEVQRSDEAADKRERVRLAEGATVVLSACTTGRGEIKAEGVLGLARGFFAAGAAAAAVVSLWSVEDGRTAAIMDQMYQYLGSIKGCTVPQALRLAMLRLARRPALDQPVSEQDVADGLQEAWKWPMHWAGFLGMGASTAPPPLRHLGGWHRYEGLECPADMDNRKPHKHSTQRSCLCS
jgi:CHAT domain-containing protein